jgi:hypothetical protein
MVFIHKITKFHCFYFPDEKAEGVALFYDWLPHHCEFMVILYISCLQDTYIVSGRYGGQVYGNRACSRDSGIYKLPRHINHLQPGTWRRYARP